MKKIILFTMFILIIATGCQKPFSATYHGENENWTVEDMVNVTPTKTEHTVTLIPKNKVSAGKIPVGIKWNDVAETKTIAKRTEEGFYKTPTESNSLNLHKQPLSSEMKITVIIEDAPVETIELNVIK